MSLSKKVDYLVSLGFLGVTIIKNQKLVFTTIPIKDHEVDFFIKKWNIWGPNFTVDEVLYTYVSYRVEGEVTTIIAEIKGSKTGMILKKSNSLEYKLLVMAIYTDTIESQVANEHLKSFYEHLLAKNMV